MSMYQMMEGTPGIGENDIAHLIVPGRYRTPDGMGAHPFTEQRALMAANFYVAHALDLQEGIIVPSGYKNPGDKSGEPWEDEDGTVFSGIPEAYSMGAIMEANGVQRGYIRPEVKSVDSVTNLLNSQEKLPDDRPVAIVAQEEHLDRFLKRIAPRTMRRDYVGILVPELPSNPDHDNMLSNLVTRIIIRGVDIDNPNSQELAAAHAEQAWKIVLGIKSVIGLGFLKKAIENHSAPAADPHQR
jgi:hypothetical protein